MERKAKRVSSGCLLWRGTKKTRSYGSIAIPTINTTSAHAVRYILEYGAIPPRLVVRHLCGNRRCVNIDHLAVGTSRRNANDKHPNSEKAFPRKRILAVAVEKSLVPKLDSLAARYRISRSDLIRKLLRESVASVNFTNTLRL